MLTGDVHAFVRSEGKSGRCGLDINMAELLRQSEVVVVECRGGLHGLARVPGST